MRGNALSIFCMISNALMVSSYGILLAWILIKTKLKLDISCIILGLLYFGQLAQTFSTTIIIWLQIPDYSFG